MDIMHVGYSRRHVPAMIGFPISGLSIHQRMLQSLTRRAFTSSTSTAMSYSRPEKAFKTAPLPYDLQPLRSLQRPPTEVYPTLPDRPAAITIPGYTHTRHVAPAAYPRSIQHGVGTLRRESEPYGNIQGHVGGSKEDKKAAIKRAITTSSRYNRGAASMPEEKEAWGSPLYLAVDRWTKVEPVRGGRSLVLTHANGFNKESWHPLLSVLLSDSSVAVNEIWGLDAVNHGASVDLNAGRMGPGNMWGDNGRDVLAFIQHAMPAQGAQTETNLEWHAAEQRAVFGIGHSYGGSALIRAAAQHPELFDGLFLVEPMARPLVQASDIKYGESLLTGALRRRSHWPSIEEASGSLLQSPFFQRWTPQVFQSYLDYGLTPHPDGGIQLATPSWCEGQVFGTDWGIVEGWETLPKLQTRTHFVMAGDAAQTGGEEATQNIVWRAPNASNERIMSAGHLIVHEKPKELSQALHRFLASIEPVKAKL